ncbi:hypothetical protein EV186_1011826 [Labedaea rhizosphaerae]|uniref:Uncharacterized protein n=1 Tax=Labedaea rhizosphaerae TaxID=598644 RepID=A0A4R6SND8_LABRH|nr:hypothetical protein EV186_1011826 [Labedaea rhizosphaerae]
MAERGEPGQQVRRSPDFGTLIFGVLTLLASAYVLTDGASWLPSVDPRWVLAAVAGVIGVLLLISSASRRSR